MDLCSAITVDKLTQSNFRIWKQDVSTILASKGLTDFILTDKLGPNASEKVKKDNATALQYIQGLISADLRYLTDGITSAYLAWQAVLAKFQTQNPVTASRIRNQILKVSFDDPSKVKESIKQVTDLVRELKLAENNFTDKDEIGLYMQILQSKYSGFVTIVETLMVQQGNIDLHQFREMLINHAARLQNDRSQQQVHVLRHTRRRGRGRGGRGNYANDRKCDYHPQSNTHWTFECRNPCRGRGSQRNNQTRQNANGGQPQQQQQSQQQQSQQQTTQQQSQTQQRTDQRSNAHYRGRFFNAPTASNEQQLRVIEVDSFESSDQYYDEIYEPDSQSLTMRASFRVDCGSTAHFVNDPDLLTNIRACPPQSITGMDEAKYASFTANYYGTVTIYTSKFRVQMATLLNSTRTCAPSSNATISLLSCLEWTRMSSLSPTVV